MENEGRYGDSRGLGSLGGLLTGCSQGMEDGISMAADMSCGPSFTSNHHQEDPS